MQEFNLVTYLTQWGPTVLVLGYGYWLMYGMYKVERDSNTELQTYLRNSDKENLNLLKDFSVLLQNIINISNSNKDHIIDSVKIEAKDIKSHVDIRIAEIKSNQGK